MFTFLSLNDVFADSNNMIASQYNLNWRKNVISTHLDFVVEIQNQAKRIQNSIDTTSGGRSRRKRGQDRCDPITLQARSGPLHRIVFLHRRLGQHRPYVSVFSRLVFEPLHSGYRKCEKIATARRTSGPSESILHRIALQQCLQISI